MDKWDKAVEYFSLYPNEIPYAWCNPQKHCFGYLFGFLGNNAFSGCLTQIVTSYESGAYNQDNIRDVEFTNKIKNDTIIPGWNKIKVEDL